MASLVNWNYQKNKRLKTSLTVRKIEREKLLRLYEWFNDGEASPYKAVIIPTNRCNLKCFFCPNAFPRSERKYRIKDELRDEDWVNIVKEGINLGIREWSLIGGGEPMLRHDAVISIIETIKSSKELTDCEIITNGTLFKTEDIKKIVSLKIDRILFSIDASDAETHDYLRGIDGTFEKASKNLKIFSELKKKFKTDKPYLKVNMVLNNKNFMKIILMIKFLKRIGVQELALHTMREYWELESKIGHLKLNKIEEKLLMKKIEEYRNFSKNLGIFLNTDMLTVNINNSKIKNERKRVSGLIKKIMETKCFEPFYSILIDSEGNVSPCSPVGHGMPNLNVLKKDLSEIWYSKSFDEIRKKIIGGVSLKYCNNCGLLDMSEHLRRKMIGLVNKNIAI